VTCWGAGSFLVSSKRPIVGILCGWCCFLSLCAFAWVCGISAHGMRPLFWAFFVAGIAAFVRDRRWPELICATLCAGAMSAALCLPFFLYQKVLAYGAHGTDMWGYIIAADWLSGHSIRDLPDLGNVPMRFNWTWHILATRERPLASASGLTPTNAYFAYPSALLASLAMALCREPRIFRLKQWTLALLPALIVVFHPLIILPWIAGFFGGAIVALFASLAFAGAAVAEEGPARTEALALGLLMLVFCASLYTVKFLLVGAVFMVVPALVSCVLILQRDGWRSLIGKRPGRLAATVFCVSVLLVIATARLVRDPDLGYGPFQTPLVGAAHFLGVFGGLSPYSWLGFAGFEPGDYNPLRNPIGCAALVGMAILFGLVSWRRWRASKDVRVPLIVGICLGCFWMVVRDTQMMTKAMPVFGLPLLVVLAAVSGELRHWALGLAAAIICCLPAVRSRQEMYTMIDQPYILCTENNVGRYGDNDVWVTLAYLNFREDQNGFNWAKYPGSYRGITHFLPDEIRERLAKNYHMPEPWPSPPS
jgi:hypothetical protein